MNSHKFVMHTKTSLYSIHQHNLVVAKLWLAASSFLYTEQNVRYIIILIWFVSLLN